jgi:hypothetical protein
MVSSVFGSQPIDVAMPVVADAVTRVGRYRPSTIQQWIWRQLNLRGNTHVDVVRVEVVRDVAVDTGPRLEGLELELGLGHVCRKRRRRVANSQEV